MAIVETTSTSTSTTTKPSTITRTTKPTATDIDVDDELYRQLVWDKYRQQVPVLEDLTAVRNECLWHLPKCIKPYILPYINDERDYIAFEFYMNAIIGLFPPTLLFWYFPSHIGGILFLLYRFIIYGQRYVLTLHVTSHRKLFKQDYWPLNYFAETILAMQFGIPPGNYYIHHVMMHHNESNMYPYDLTSTIRYQRDDIRSLIHYFYMYFCHSAFYLPYYAYMKNRHYLLMLNVTCLIAYFGMSTTALLVGYNPIFILWMVHIPDIFMGCLLMHGNFCQHVFVDPDDPSNGYKYSFNFINHDDNQRTYNDGYHIQHHLNSTMHWSCMPVWFETNIHLLAKNDALVFQKINNDMVYAYVIQGKYEELYKHWVQLKPGPDATIQQFKDILQKRLQPIINIQQQTSSSSSYTSINNNNKKNI